jgi:hypothetical protein
MLRRSFLLFALFTACATPDSDSDDPDSIGTKADGLGPAGTIPVLPSPSGSGALTPWGGIDPSRWRPEAILANAVSDAMNRAWGLPGARDVVVAVPVHMISSEFFEFGDGQANAAPSFEWWHEARPPVVATLVLIDGGPARVFFRFDRALPSGGNTFEVRYRMGDADRLHTITATQEPSGDRTAEWVVPDELGWGSRLATTMVSVHPRGWADWFPLGFRFPVRTIADLRGTVPEAQRRFADGGDVVDHERVSARFNPGDARIVKERLAAHPFSAGYNQTPYMPQDIHAVFPFGGRNYVTGVGAGWTWVADRPAAPFKVMYTCFERRRPDLEATAPDGGVASGGGWHRIGDPAETILNDLESGPLMVAAATGNALPASALPSGTFAYHLTDVATFRWLQPGEAFVTRRGSSSQPSYHWYFFHHGHDVCTEEWVHPCVPGDSLDFACGGSSVVGFEVRNASTSWGQDVYVLGSAPELGAWNAAAAVRLAPTSYPTWTGQVTLPKNATLAFKFIKKDGAGRVVWEGGADRIFTVPSAATSSYAGTWR